VSARSSGPPLPHRAIRDLIRFADEAAELAARGRDAFLNDHMLQLAGLAIIIRIGEAANRVPQAERDAHPAVAWRQMVGMRNRIAHEYDVVDFELVWEVIESKAPEMRALLAG
jgi:uncharacterized protein with HEPN domain